MKLYQAILSSAIKRDKQNDFVRYWQEQLDHFMRFLPSGSGIDNGVKLDDYDETKMVLLFEFHHMDENGFYTEWSHQKLIVKANLLYDFDMTFLSDYEGDNKESFEDYVCDVFWTCLNEEVYKKEIETGV